MAWVWQTLGLHERIVLIVGEPLIGKTSLLLELQRDAAVTYLPVYVHLPTLATQNTGPLMAGVIEHVHQRLLAEAEIQASEISPELSGPSWRALRDLPAGRQTLLLLDDLDQILAAGQEAGWAFIDDLADQMARHSELQIVCTVRSQEALRRVDRLPMTRAPWRRMEPLSRVEAFRLMKLPVEGLLDYDYEALTRIDELTGRLPYFIQLLCGFLYEQRAHAGHAGVVDIEPALNAIGSVDIPLFQRRWEQATPEGKLILSALGAQKGAYEVFTPAELSTTLRSHGVQADLPDIIRSLGQLVEIGAVEQLGAISFRFPVEVFRYWLRFQHPMRATLSRERWNPRRRAPRPESELPASSASRVTRLTITILVPVVTVLVALALFLLPGTHRMPPSPTPTASPELATRAALLAPVTGTLAAGSQSVSAVTPTPTATRPQVLARSMPAIAFMQKAGNAPWQIWVMGADGGSPTQLTDGSSDDSSPVWSPDGQRLAFVSDRDGNREIYVMNLDGSALVNASQQAADDWTPAWSPDGTELAFSSMRDGNWEIYVMWADGGYPVRLTEHAESDISPTWSPDGRRIAFATKRHGNWDIYVMDRDGKNLKRLTDSTGNDTSPVWSPDGHYIAFESSREGNVDIYRMLVDGKEQINLTQSKGANDHWPTWSPDSRNLAFCSNREGDWHIYTMDLDGANPVRLTPQDKLNHQGPAWRP